MQQQHPQDALTTQVLQRLQLLPVPLQHFVNFLLSHNPESPPLLSIKPGTLIGLRGILKDAPIDLDDDVLKDAYVDYLLKKHQ